MSDVVLRLKVCDFCRAQTSDAGAAHWFFVRGGKEAKHACIDCGHKIHELLDKMDIEHTFKCKQYTDGKEMGEIVRVRK
mgnify:CR=1 FL=1